jgi:glutamate N-acetyltransferase / amino-acid N-acetyltransferase
MTPVSEMRLVVPRGFLFASGTAGIKASGRPDVALAEMPQGASAAAMFTRNRVVAAPVEVGREHLRASRGRLRALVVNSGNANCATGPAGRSAADATCAALAGALHTTPELVLPSSTGIIGVPLPVDRLVAALPDVLSRRSASEDAAAGFARAIMTTDTRMKTASTELALDRRPASVLGIAKGAGMVHPDMATLLVYLFTDAAAPPPVLRRILRRAVARSLNCISIDGDTSTNDTVVLMASGAAGARVAADEASFASAVMEVCDSLAAQIVADGEGVTHVVKLRVDGAASDGAADRIVRTIAHSLLVKTAWAGADPNWGRLLAAVGRAGASIDPNAVAIWIAGQKVCEQGAAVPFDAAGVHRRMSEPAYEIRINVGNGPGTARFLTTDLTTEYVRINADYST